MFWKKKQKQQPSPEPKLQAPVSKPSVPESTATVPDVTKARITTVTIAADKLPYLKTLLARYKENIQKQEQRDSINAKVQQTFRANAYQLVQLITIKCYESARKDPTWLGQEDVTRVLCACAGDILKQLEVIRSQGWDGNNIYYQEPCDPSPVWEAERQLRNMVDALENNPQITLDIPPEYENAYFGWIIQTLNGTLRYEVGS
jgi:hypothetical protein